MEFWKPGGNAPGQMDKNSTKNADDYAESKVTKDQLDVCKYRQQILYLIEQFDLVLVIGETGTGKTSQIPLYIHEAGYAKQGRMVGVICRNSTCCVNHAAKASDQIRTFIGGKVGYSIPFDDNCSHSTEIKYTSPHMFLQQVLIDPLLSEYSILLIDDVNERLFENDVVFAIINKIMKKRSDLKVMLLSNSEDDEKLLDYFKSDKLKAISLTIESRCYPVQEYYLEEECADYLTEALNTVLYIHQNEPNGDILVFLNTVEEIESLSTILLGQDIVGLRIMTILGDGTVSQYLTGGAGARSIIICNMFIEFNFISNVKFVVDSGFQMLRIFNYMEGLTRMVKLPATSSVSAKRARLAGLNRPGKCFRLYSSKTKNDEEDVYQMVDLTWTVLILYALGVKNVLLFDFPRPPAVSRIAYALEHLFAIGAIDKNASLESPIGSLILEFPVPPQIARMVISIKKIVKSTELGCSDEILTASAMILCGKSIYVGKVGRKYGMQQYAVAEGDLITDINAFQAFLMARKSISWCKTKEMDYKALTDVIKIRKALERKLSQLGFKHSTCGRNPRSAIQCILTGFAGSVARLQRDGSFKALRGGANLKIDPDSVLATKPPGFVVFCSSDGSRMKWVTKIEPSMLISELPYLFRHKST